MVHPFFLLWFTYRLLMNGLTYDGRSFINPSCGDGAEVAKSPAAICVERLSAGESWALAPWLWFVHSFWQELRGLYEVILVGERKFFPQGIWLAHPYIPVVNWPGISTLNISKLLLEDPKMWTILCSSLGNFTTGSVSVLLQSCPVSGLGRSLERLDPTFQTIHAVRL